MTGRNGRNREGKLGLCGAKHFDGVLLIRYKG